VPRQGSAPPWASSTARLPRRVGTIRTVRRRDYVGPVMCALGAACLLGALTVDLSSTAAKALMAVAAVLFVPGAYVTLALVRRVAGPPN